ncbi:hypothetical protein M513_04378 [Trichuris suis]|uniref:Tc1-like transposase DDE domain-containing protein n=1 Tax=Trichuris suis TaxID=68888 RepID=A0A085MBT2_9BILA|nr:hypothetical protein M513_04378 [Trichuris suis]
MRCGSVTTTLSLSNKANSGSTSILRGRSGLGWNPDWEGSWRRFSGIQKLREEIKEKRRRKLSRKVLLQHDNAPVHRAKVALAAIQQCGFGQIDHPPYSPDLAPSDYFLFGNLKQHLRGTVFSDDNELKSAVQDYFNSREKNFFFNGLMNLKSRCEKCIEVEGQYI